jgi:hypothetical protein
MFEDQRKADVQKHAAPQVASVNFEVKLYDCEPSIPCAAELWLEDQSLLGAYDVYYFPCAKVAGMLMPRVVRFTFTNEEDAVMFKLRWGSA